MVVFRLVDENDAKEYLDFFKAVTSESDNLASNIAEVEKLSVDDERSFIKGMNESASFSIAAFDGDRIIGSCDIRIAVRERLKHRAEMGIAVRKEYWGKGVAQSLLEKAIVEAAKRGVLKIQLTVREDNIRAKRLYIKNGFKLVGSDRMLFLIDGKYIDGEIYDLIIKQI